MTPKEAVVAAMAANRDWMSTHIGIVEFILSECELENVGNDEYDDVILRNPEEARSEAKLLDAEGQTFQVQLSLVIPRGAWARAYGSKLDAAGVRKFLQNALFVSTDRVPISVHSIVDMSE